MTVSGVNEIFGCDSWYVKDEAGGEVIWPEQWAERCQPSTELHPWRYMIVERDHFPRFDQAKSRTVFDGDCVIWLENVPYEAEPTSVVTWIHGALECTLPHIKAALDKVRVLDAQFEVRRAQGRTSLQGL